MNLICVGGPAAGRRMFVDNELVKREGNVVRVPEEIDPTALVSSAEVQISETFTAFEYRIRHYNERGGTHTRTIAYLVPAYDDVKTQPGDHFASLLQAYEQLMRMRRTDARLVDRMLSHSR